MTLPPIHTVTQGWYGFNYARIRILDKKCIRIISKVEEVCESIYTHGKTHKHLEQIRHRFRRFSQFLVQVCTFQAASVYDPSLYL